MAAESTWDRPCPMQRTLHGRIVAAAADVTASEGWAKVTMARLAAKVGVSRQTVYNEVGGKPALAEAMVLAELTRFLEIVEAAFDEQPDDLTHALRGACRGVLEHARDNELLHAIVSATHGAETELLPLLTTHASSLLVTASEVVGGRVADYRIDLSPAQVRAVVDVVVRTVLSHVMQPGATPEQTADDLAWLVGRLLGRA